MGFPIIKQKSFWIIASVGICIAIFSRCGTDSMAGVPDTVDFNYHVKPILVQKCYLCHGPDESSRKANLRLDTYEGATALRKDGARAIDPGHAANSLIIDRIYHKDPDLVMPTPESNLKLTPQEMAILEKWIKQGAKYDQHWAFIPPDTTLLEKKYRGNPIDYFIEKELDARGIKAAPAARPEVLLRRVAFLLTGLPPTEEEQHQFLSASNGFDYPKLVDYYLASPRFGERWARHWMDIARYAETRGHEFDFPIQDAWRYRDYLIRAFNEDIPYDQLLREHLAGDLLENPRKGTENLNESALGTVFLTMAEGAHSPVDIRKDEADRIDNMIDVTGKAFLGLTISCARCHDHKFDPISAKEYYSFYGVMEGTRFGAQPVILPSREQTMEELVRIQQQVREWAHQQMKAPAAIPAQQVYDQSSIVPADSGYRVLANFTGMDLSGWKSDGRAFGNRTTLGDPVFDPQFQLMGIREGMASSRLTATGIPGALRSPDFIIASNFIGVEAAGWGSMIRIIIDNFQLIRWPIYGGLEDRVDATDWKQYRFDVGQWKGHKAYIEILPGVYDNFVFKQQPDSYIDVRYAIAYNDKWVAPENQSAVLGNLNRGFKKQKADEAIRRLLEKERELRHALQTEPLNFFYGVTDGDGKNSPVFVRGNHQEPSSEKVSRTFLTALGTPNHNLDVKGSGRKEFAEALLDKNNPLTSRVMVNRIWHHLFGKGIVETVDNFGLQGKLPSHPELLDYLSLYFKKNRYSMKQVIRLVLLSETFQRSVVPTTGAKEKDPDNTALSYFPLRRLEAEAIRDALLTVSGRLDTTMYGAPVPQHFTSFMNGLGKPAVSGPLDGAGRRSVYLEVRRNFLDPIMTSFDRPIPFTAFGKREVTNVPAQSLILLNDPFVMQQAGVMAERLEKKNFKTDEEKIEWLYKTCFARVATQTEMEDAKAFIETLKAKSSRTVWKDYIHTIFNLKEFIYLN